MKKKSIFLGIALSCIMLASCSIKTNSSTESESESLITESAYEDTTTTKSSTTTAVDITTTTTESDATTTKESDATTTTESDSTTTTEPDVTTTEDTDMTTTSDTTTTTKSDVTTTMDDSEDTTTTDGTYGASDDFMATEDGYFVKENSCYTITTGGTYTLAGSFDGMIYISIDTMSMSGSYDVELDLEGVTLTNSSNSVIYIAEPTNEDISSDVTISAKSGTENTITDKRSLEEEEDDTQGSAAIYSETDLKLKGKGTLSVTGSYNNGIHSKDDLTIKNLTLSVKAPNNALKGNDSVTIESGTVTVISTGGDGIKTTNTSLSSKGNQKGTVTISGGTVDIYSCCDGIDAAYNAEISSTAVVNIYTSNYSTYSDEVVAGDSTTLYLCVSSSSSGGGRGPGSSSSSSSNYRYAAYFYNEDVDSGVWENFTSISSSSQQGGMGGPGGSSSSYYSADMPSGYTNVRIYKFESTNTTNSTSSYTACTSGNTINSAYDMIKLSTSTTGDLTASWSTYSTTSSGGGPGSMGPGGMDSGNTDKSDYSAKGIKASNAIYITGGTVTIKSYDDALHANNEDTIESTGETGLGLISISGGVVTLTAADDGIHADQDVIISGTADVTVLTAYEGIEGNRIYFNGGSVDVYATDDAVNAATCNGSYTPLVEITDGYVSLEAGSGDTDTLDSNGNINISGGVLIIKNDQTSATSNTGGTIDLDGTMSVTGGIIISCGTWCSEASLSCKVTNTSTSLSAGDYTLEDSSGNVITSFTLKSSVKGYRIYMDSTYSGTYTLYCGTTKITSITC